MQVSLSATGGLERRLEVAVPATEVASEVEQRLKQISRTARLKGFRPGKAPYAVVRKQFGEQVHTEVISELMRSSFAKALSQEKLTPATSPRIEPLAVGPGSDLKYAAVFEVMPEVKIAAIEGITVERPVSSVTDPDIAAMIESMRRQRPIFTAVERGAGDTDRVVIDYNGFVAGQPFEGSTGTDINVVIGSKQSMPELEEGLKGAQPGETRNINVSFPAGHPNKAIAGQSAELQVTIKRVEEQSLPAVDDEFARAYGVEEGGVEALTVEVRKSMERELADVIRNRVRGQVLDTLYRQNPVDVPRALLEEQVQHLQIDTARRMGVRDASQLPAREPFVEPARRRVALGLLISQIVQAEQIKLERERVEARLTDMVAAYPEAQQEEARRAYLQNQDAMRQLESAAIEDQVVEWLLGKANITDKPMTFKEVTGFGQEQT